MQLNKLMLSLVYTNFFLILWPPSFPNPGSIPINIIPKPITTKNKYIVKKKVRHSQYFSKHFFVECVKQQQQIYNDFGLSNQIVSLAFFFFFLYISIYKKRECTNSNVVQCFGLFNSCALFIRQNFFFSFTSVVCVFLSFLLNIYYLYVHLQLHQLNKFL